MENYYAVIVIPKGFDLKAVNFLEVPPELIDCIKIALALLQQDAELM